MGKMADITWIKLRIDMFDDEKIKLIQALPDGDTILVIWIRILALATRTAICALTTNSRILTKC